MYIKKELKKIYFYILFLSLGISVTSYLYIVIVTPTRNAQILKLEQIYALCALTLLYFTLLCDPFCFVFQKFPYKILYIRLKSGLGLAAFYFALLHALTAFFGEFKGFFGLSFLNEKFLIVISIGFVALITLTLIATILFRSIVFNFPDVKRIKINTALYFAGLLVLIHALFFGDHFSNLSNLIPTLLYFGLVFLLLLETKRFESFIKEYIAIPKFSLSSVLIAIVLGIIFLTVIHPLNIFKTGNISLNIHSNHGQEIDQGLANSQLDNINELNKTSALQGDKFKRYTVSMVIDPQQPKPNQNFTLHFTVYDASSGNKISSFSTLNDKQMHLIIIDDSFSYFKHLYPDYSNSSFDLTTNLPQNGLYHFYITYQPNGSIEQQTAFTLQVGDALNLTIPKAVLDTQKLKSINGYDVSIDTHGALLSTNISVGLQTISYKITNKKYPAKIVSLHPYLVMIKQDTYDFVHIPSFSLATVNQKGLDQAVIDFIPIGVFSPFKPGMYRLFLELNPDGTPLTVDFGVELK